MKIDAISDQVTRMGVPVENKFNTSVQVVSCSPDGWVSDNRSYQTH